MKDRKRKGQIENLIGKLFILLLFVFMLVFVFVAHD